MRRPCTTLALLSLAAALLGACAPERAELIGTWTGEDADGLRHTFSFAERGRAIWAIEGSGVDEDFALRYAFADTTEPHHLDLSGFERGRYQGETLYCLFEWTGADAFRLDCAPGVRPSDFTAHTLVYMKVER